MLLKSVITYFTGGTNYSIPPELGLSYLLLQLRFLVYGYVISYYFQVQYSEITAALGILLADFRFFIDFNDYIESVLTSEEEDDEEE